MKILIILISILIVGKNGCNVLKNNAEDHYQKKKNHMKLQEQAILKERILTTLINIQRPEKNGSILSEIKAANGINIH